MKDDYDINIKTTSDKRIKTTISDSSGLKVASFTFEANSIEKIVDGYIECLQALKGE